MKRRYRNIIRHISTLELIQTDDSTDANGFDLLADLDSHRTTSLFLGQYSKKGILFAFEKLGLIRELKKKGLTHLFIDVNTSDPFQHFLRIFHIEGKQKFLISEMVIRKGIFSIPPKINYKRGKGSYAILIIEWLLIQNPKGKFTRKRPQLPNQDFPGLGLSSAVFEILYWMGRRTKSDGILIVPNSFHTGLIYAKEFHFVNPKMEALIKKMKKDLLKKNSFAQVAWAAEEKKIFLRSDNSPLTWKPSEMLLPTSRTIHDYFFSRNYRAKLFRYFIQTKLFIEPGYKKQFNSEWKAIK